MLYIPSYVYTIKLFCERCVEYDSSYFYIILDRIPFYKFSQLIMTSFYTVDTTYRLYNIDILTFRSL